MGQLGIIAAAALALAAPTELATQSVTGQAAHPAHGKAKHKGKRKAKHTRKIAAVKLEIKLENGEVIQTRGTLEWSEQGALSIETDGGVHDVSLAIERVPKSLALKVTLAYDRDGNPIVAPFEYEGKLWKREVLRIEGGLSLAVTVTPKEIEVKPPPPERDGLDVVEGEDPLGGL